MKSTISALSKREFTILRCKYSKNERDKQSRALIFRSECRLYSPFTANIVKTSEISNACFDISQRVQIYSPFTANIVKTSEISKTELCFTKPLTFGKVNKLTLLSLNRGFDISQRVKNIFAVYGKYSKNECNRPYLQKRINFAPAFGIREVLRKIFFKKIQTAS